MAWRGTQGKQNPQIPVYPLLPRAPPLWATTTSLETEAITSLANYKLEAWQDDSN